MDLGRSRVIIPALLMEAVTMRNAYPNMTIPMEKLNQFIALKLKFSVVTSIDMLIAAQIVCY
jgi:hypothetical protein